jgi:hypothetical protein
MPINPQSFHLPIAKIFTGCAVASLDMAGAAEQTVTMLGSFSSIDSYDVYIADEGNSNRVPDNLGVVKLSTNKFKVKTANGAVSSQILNWVAVGN